ncbi:hypothetical protein [Elizabethkingia anophelis]|uniref:hypothetical protein n=1 Tax=Elizabethkingia anophelis TaxID=1117645 RepID=UPI0007509A8B|nr:hypothetical protein [Elizabethkingia anophelis]AQW92100.1 hypothetical protein BBD28_16265 [Elizabethkingia anophelis]KUY14584.1 hypothetical protein ATB94_07045 [Elizabethkingia anophelis]
MAYSLIEQHSRDLDIFLRDSNKFIHFASAGGLLPEQAINSDEYNNLIIEAISSDTSEFEIDINPNLIELLGLNQDSLTTYLESFIEMARKGFFSYDKSKLGDFEDQTFHLVARPRQPITDLLHKKYNILDRVITTQTDFPTEFEPFNISEFL